VEVGLERTASNPLFSDEQGKTDKIDEIDAMDS
jgi:hypothetical protein